MTDIDAIRQREQAATPGPWEAGDRWRVAGVLAERFGEGKCAYCSYLGEPLWVGEDSINCRRMLAHHHRDEGDDINLHVITAGARGCVAGNYAYEEGGIVEPVDAEFIAHARTDIPALLDLLATAQQDIRDRYEQIARLERHIAGLETQCNEQMHALNLSNHLAVVRALCDQYKDAPPPIFRGPDLSEHGKGYNAGTRDMARAVLGTLTEVTS